MKKYAREQWACCFMNACICPNLPTKKIWVVPTMYIISKRLFTDFKLLKLGMKHSMILWFKWGYRLLSFFFSYTTGNYNLYLIYVDEILLTSVMNHSFNKSLPLSPKSSFLKYLGLLDYFLAMRYKDAKTVCFTIDLRIMEKALHDILLESLIC